MLAYLVVGGVRSGKSAIAQRWAEQQAPQRLYVATCQAQDEEMADRIARHQAMRGAGWQAIDAPLAPLENITAFLKCQPAFHGSIVLDCLSMWLANLLASNPEERPLLQKAECLLHGLAQISHPCAIVSAECGLGIIPANSLARKYGDLLGEINQKAAALSRNVLLACCGLPLILKGNQPD